MQLRITLHQGCSGISTDFLVPPAAARQQYIPNSPWFTFPGAEPCHCIYPWNSLCMVKPVGSTAPSAAEGSKLAAATSTALVPPGSSPQAACGNHRRNLQAEHNSRACAACSRNDKDGLFWTNTQRLLFRFNRDISCIILAQRYVQKSSKSAYDSRTNRAVLLHSAPSLLGGLSASAHPPSGP